MKITITTLILAPDLFWHVSKLIDPRRSNGEKDFADLSGKSLLPRKIRHSIRMKKG
jgi:hypothetical protein